MIDTLAGIALIAISILGTTFIIARQIYTDRNSK